MRIGGRFLEGMEVWSSMTENSHPNKISRAVAEFYETFGSAFADTRGMTWGLMSLATNRLREGDVLLDVGAGNSRLADALPSGVKYVAIEPSSTLREAAVRRLSSGSAAKSDAAVLAGGFPTLPVGDATADVVACFAVLHHLVGRRARQGAVKELARVTKPGGWLVLSVWNLRCRKFFSWQTWLASVCRLPFVWGGGFGDLWIPWNANGVSVKRFVHAFTVSELRGLCSPTEWTVETCVPWGIDRPASVSDGPNVVLVATRK